MKKKQYKISFNSKISKNILLKSSLTKKFSVGDFIELTYRILDEKKDRFQHYKGIIISINNSNNFKLKSYIQGIFVDQIFNLESPNIIKIVKKNSLKIRRAKLYFLKNNFNNNKFVE